MLAFRHAERWRPRLVVVLTCQLRSHRQPHVKLMAKWDSRRYRRFRLTAVKNAFASGHHLEMPANGLVLMIQMLLEEFRELVSATPGERIND